MRVMKLTQGVDIYSKWEGKVWWKLKGMGTACHTLMCDNKIRSTLVALRFFHVACNEKMTFAIKYEEDKYF